MTNYTYYQFEDQTSREACLDYLKNFKSEGLYLISIYVSKNIENLRAKLKLELAGVANIKSKSTQREVSGALGRIIGVLNTKFELPLAIFSSSMETIVVRLPESLARDDYTCGKRFDYDNLDDYSDLRWGLVLIDSLQVTVGVWQNNRIKTLHNQDYMIPGKVKAGGQSNQRFEQKRMELIEHMLNEVTGKVVSLFTSHPVSRIFLGGVDPLLTRLTQRLGAIEAVAPLLAEPMGIVYTGPEGLQLLIDRLSCDEETHFKKYREDERNYRMVVRALARSSGGGLAKYCNVPLQGIKFFLLSHRDYAYYYCMECRQYSEERECEHGLKKNIALLPNTYFFGPGQLSDFIRVRYGGIVTFDQ